MIQLFIGIYLKVDRDRKNLDIHTYMMSESDSDKQFLIN